MNFIITKIVLLSFVLMTVACGQKEEPEPQAKKEETTQEEKNDAKKGEINFKATDLRNKSTYKSPKF